LVTDSHNILAKWRNHLSQLLNIYGVSEVRQAEILTAEPIVPEPSAFEFEMAFEKLKDTNHQVWSCPSRMVKAMGRTNRPEIY